MSLITTVDGIPLYTTVQEAVAWAVNNGLTGHHQHVYKEEIGYMGAESHEIAVQGPVTPVSIPVPVPVPVPVPIPTPTTTPTTTTTTTTTGGGGGAGGGGGGGY